MFAATENRLERSRAKGARTAGWVALSAICVVVDFYTGPAVQFPIFYLVPISLASWYDGRRWGLTLALLLPLVRLLFRTVWDQAADDVTTPVINAAIRITVFAMFAWLVDRTARQMRELRRMHLLEGMAGVCSQCKRVHDVVSGSWQPIDAYVAQHRTDVIRDVCPECAGRAAETFDRR